LENTNKICNFAFIMLELNNVRLKDLPQPLTMIARNGQLTVLNMPPHVSHRWFSAILGFEQPLEGFISIDGEPLTVSTLHILRRQMAWVPDSLEAVGEVAPYLPPTVQDIFALKANRELPISNGMLAEEIRKTGASGNKATLLAVGVLLKRPILLIEQPLAASADYLRYQAEQGTTVIVSSQDSVYTDRPLQ
jgi:ABC-type thiamine transport system ATPase subunit